MVFIPIKGCARSTVFLKTRCDFAATTNAPGNPAINKPGNPGATRCVIALTKPNAYVMLF